MNGHNEVVNLCVKGTQAEYAGQVDLARKLYAQAWEIATSDFEACIAAHYAARFQDDPQEKLRWDQIALERAKLANQDDVTSFYPSLYLNLGQAHELLGHAEEARRFYKLAASYGAIHDQEQRPCKK